LNVLQDKEIQRIGSNEIKKINVRVISATHKDLKEMILNKQFREDLYYRLHVLNLDIPPLRKRVEDIDLLTKHILNKISNIRRVPTYKLTKEAETVLKKYLWPGNVRELENTLEQVTAFSSNSVITADMFSFNQKNLSTQGNNQITLTIDELVKNHILETISSCNGNKAKASRMLGISERGLYNKINKYKLN
jgi:DNA-binding NtrC family response regulator